MDARVEATQERLPDARVEATQVRLPDARVEATPELPDARVEATQVQQPDVWSKSLAAAHKLAGRNPASAKWGGLSFTPGRLPCALRNGFAVRAAPAAQ